MARRERYRNKGAYRPKAGTLFCYEATCREYFKTLEDYKRHRTGPWYARRCMTRGEMRDAGLIMNQRSTWYVRPPKTPPATP